MNIIGYLVNILSALILVGLDLPFIDRILESVFFKNLNKSLEILSSFSYKPEEGPIYSKIDKGNNSFNSLLNVIFTFFPHFKKLKDEIKGIYCEEALSFNPSTVRPVSFWLYNDKGKFICSYFYLLILIENYKRRKLNQIGTALLIIGSLIMLIN